MPFAQIISPNPTPEAPPEVAVQSALSEAPGFWENLGTQAQESVVGRHFPGQNAGDIVQDFEQSWDSEQRRKQAVESGAFANDAALPPRSGRPLLSVEEANARYSFEGPDGKQVKIANEPLPDEVARELGDRAKEKMRRQSIMARWNAAHSFETPLGQLPTPYGFATQLLTPDTAAMALIPGIGEEALLAKLGTGLIPRTAAKGISGATTFAAGSAAMMAADAALPDWRGERADLSLREGLNELYLSAAMGAIMHAAINPAIGAAWRQAQRIVLQRAGKAVEATEAPPAPSVAPTAPMPAVEAVRPPVEAKPADIIRFYHGTASESAEGFMGKTFVTPHFDYARDYRGGPNNVLYTDFTKEEAIKRGLWDEINNFPINGSIEDGAQALKPHTIIEKPIGDIAEALTQIESADGPTKRKAMDAATGQVLEGKPVEVRPHFDPAKSEEVIEEQQRQDRDGFAPGIPAAKLAEETAKVYTPEKPDPQKFVKDMGGPVVAPEPVAAPAEVRQPEIPKEQPKQAETSTETAQSVNQQQQEAAPQTVGKAPERSLRDRIHDAYLNATGGKYNARGLLKDIRKQLPDVPREVLDKELLALQREEDAALYPIDNRPKITQEDREAAIHIGSEPRHILWIERPRPEGHFALTPGASEANPELRKGIEDLIAQHLPGVEARVKERLTFSDLPEKTRERFGIGEGELGKEFHGFSDPTDKIIYLSLAAEHPIERAHEEIAHFLDETGLLPAADRAILDDAASKGDWRTKLDIDNRYRDFYSRAYEGDRLEQALQAETRAQMLAARVSGDDFGEKANGVIDKLLRFFEAVRNFIKGRGFQTLDDVFQRYAGGEYGRGEGAAGEGRFALPSEPSPAEQMEGFANQAMRFFISKAGPDINALLKPYARELDAFGRKTTSQDALAFFRSYFTQPSAAQSLAPGFTRAIDELFARIDPNTHADFVTRAKEYEASIQHAEAAPSDTAGLSTETAQQLAKFENILKTFDKSALLPEELGELDQTEKDLAAATTPEAKEEAARKRADAIVNAIARKDRMSDVQGTGQGARGAWLALASDMHGTWRGWRDSVEAQWQSLAQLWRAVPDNQIRQAGLNNMAAKGLQDREVNRELWKLNASQGQAGMPATENKPARRLAEILLPTLETAKDRMNEAGARIADALDYVLSTYHDPYKIRRAAGYTDGKWWQVGALKPLAAVDDAFKAWWKFTLPRLNHAKTFADLTQEEGETVEQARERFGRSVFNALITGVHMRFGGEVSADESGMATMQPAFEGTHNIARALSQHRVLFWKDADSWTDYHERFGPATTTTHMVMQHLDHSARMVALMNHWGTNPAANLNLVIQKVQHEYRNSDPDGLVEFGKKIGNLKNVMAHLDGSANMPGNEMWANINRAYRSEYSSSVLGATGLTHLVTLPWTLPSELKRHGIDRWQSLSMLLQRLVTDATGRGDDARREVLAELGALPDSISRQMQRQFQPWGQDSPLNTVSGWASSAAANVMKYNGLNYFFDTAQTMARESVAAKVAANLGKDYGALDHWHRQMLGLYGIGEREWNLLRTVKPSEANGIAYLTPGDIRRGIDRDAVERSLPEKETETTPEDVNREIDRLSDQLGSYYSETAHRSTIGGSVRERAMLLGSSRPGTLWGEVARHSLLYKMWPVAQFFQGLSRDWYLSGSGGERAMNLFYMMALGTFGGLMRMSINDLMRGNPQRDASDPKTLLAALAQGGGLGIYGDFLFGEIGRNNADFVSTLMGPAASDIGRLSHIYFNAWNYELDQTGHRKNTGLGDVAQWTTSKIPLHNLIYMHAALNYLLFYHLYESLDPGFWERTNRRLTKERGRSMIGYRPGAGVPTGIPPFYLQYPSGQTEGLLSGG